MQKIRLSKIGLTKIGLTALKLYKIGAEKAAAVLALFWDGEPGADATYTRKDPAYTSAGTFAQDKSPYEIVDGKKRFVQYESPNNPPGITPPQPVNKGTTSLLAEDIDDASYLFDAAQGDCITTPLIPSVDITGDFSIDLYIKRNTFNSQAVIYESDAGGSNRFYLREGAVDGEIVIGLYSWTLAPNGIIDNEAAKYTVSLTGTHGKLFKDDVLLFEETNVVLDLPTTPIFIGADISRINNFDGYIWDFQIKDGSGNYIAHYPLAEYRKDTFVEDISGNGNHGTASRTIDNLIQENQGFGYPVNERARLPWVSPLGTKYGVKGALNGVDGNPAIFSIPFTKYIPHALPEDVVVNGDFATDTDWNKGAGVTISGGSANFATTGIGANSLYQNCGIKDGKQYIVKTTVSAYTSGNLTIWAGGSQAPSVNKFDIKDVGVNISFIDLRDTSSSNGFIIFGAQTTAFTGSIDSIEVAEALILLTDSNGNPILYIDPFDGLVKGYDGTNTCESTNPVVVSSEVTGWFSFNGPENEMWITLDGVKGAVVTCLDALPDVGNRLFGLTSGTYQSIENLYFNNELPYVLLVDGAAPIFDGVDQNVEYL